MKAIDRFDFKHDLAFEIDYALEADPDHAFPHQLVRRDTNETIARVRDSEIAIALAAVWGERGTLQAGATVVIAQPADAEAQRKSGSSALEQEIARATTVPAQPVAALPTEKNATRGRPATGAVMPCGAVVTNVYEAYEAGRVAALPAEQAQTEQADDELEKAMFYSWRDATIARPGWDDSDWHIYQRGILDGQRKDNSGTAFAAAEQVPTILDVRDFGAVGDGATDDTAGFQAAVDAAIAAQERAS